MARMDELEWDEVYISELEDQWGRVAQGFSSSPGCEYRVPFYRVNFNGFYIIQEVFSSDLQVMTPYRDIDF